MEAMRSLKTEYMLAVVALGVLLPAVGFAGALPDAIGSYRLGQKLVGSATQAIVYEGHRGKLTAFADDNGTLEMLRFTAMTCDGGDNGCAKRKEVARQKLVRQLGARYGQPLPATSTWVWRDKRLTVVDEGTGGLGEELVIYLELVDETRPGGARDGFAEFYQRFRAAVRAGNAVAVAGMVSYPFEMQCGGGELEERADFLNAYGELFSTENVETRLTDTPVFVKSDKSRPYYSQGVRDGYQFRKVSGAWRLAGSYCAD
jgi:hypothetical protein